MLILLGGKAKSDREAPELDVPPLFETFAELEVLSFVINISRIGKDTRGRGD